MQLIPKIKDKSLENTSMKQQTVINNKLSRLDLIKAAATKFSAPSTVFSKWLDEFLLTSRGMEKADGSSLYRYAMTEAEYEQLCHLYHQNPKKISSNQQYYDSWCACYCLIVSEIYRREYNGGEWSWDLIDNKLNIKFDSPTERYQIIQAGMRFWKRPIQTQVNKCRKQYLGTLFAEGGLPIKLLSSNNNTFSRIIKYGLEKYQESENNYLPLEKYLEDKKDYLAQAFCNPETIELLAKTIHILMALAKQYDLANRENLVEYLDNVAENWRQRFPFLLPEKEADDLINHWLSNAADEQIKSQKSYFSCSHFVEYDKWQLFAEINLPEYFSFVAPANYQGRTIFQWSLFEGTQPISNVGGTLFAKLEHGQFSFRIPKSTYNIPRFCKEEPLSIQFFADGRWLFTKWLPETHFDCSSPLLFTQKCTENKWQLIANADYSQANDEYLICLPHDFFTHQEIQKVYEDKHEKWWRYNGNLLAENTKGQTIQVDFVEHLAQQIILTGKQFYNYEHADGKGLPIYRGFPVLQTPDNLSCTKIEINGEIYSKSHPKYGTFQAVFFHDQTSLLRRKITVLPEDLSYSWLPANQHKPAELTIKTNQKLYCNLFGEHINFENNNSKFIIQTSQETYPEKIVLHIGSDKNLVAVLKLRLPFNGAYLYDENGTILKQKQLNIQQLMGKCIALFSTTREIKMQWQLLPENIVRERALPISENGELIHLYALKDEFSQLLACSNSQDSKIRITFFLHGSAKSLLTLDLANYNGVAQWNNQVYQYNELITLQEDKRTHFVIKKSYSDEYASRDVEIEIMRLDAPERGSCILPESEMLGNGRYTLPPERYGSGLWLIYPAQTSSIQFRPTIFDNSGERFFEPPEHHSLAIAARVFHPEYNKNAIANIIKEMAEDPKHEGWQYFESLKKYFSHLPLSVFETWKELARQRRAMAMAVLCLHLDAGFCERISKELAFIWSWLPQKHWRNAIGHYKEYWKNIMENLPAEMSIPLSETVIPTDLMNYHEILRNHIFRGYLTRQENTEILTNIMNIIQNKSYYLNHYNQIRNFEIPQTLKQPLQNWLNNKARDVFYKDIENLSRVDFDKPIVWLPIFTAYVRADQAKPREIWTFYDINSQAKLLDAYYQIYSLNPEFFDYVCGNFSSALIGEEPS